ncbi:MAG: hypothetical protein LBJ64_08830, partial [Deltaproteobacteria bacterium]|nr:hypothetical protein [Deltaproteobacteria bacterium]
YEGVELPKKYEKFFGSLKYSHQEIFKIGRQDVSFTFFHALPYPNYAVAEQRVSSHKEFNDFLDKKYVPWGEEKKTKGAKKGENAKSGHARLLEQSSVWSRNYSIKKGYQGEVIVHGHNPTVNYKELYNPERGLEPIFSQFRNYPQSVHMPFLYGRHSESGYGDTENLGRFADNLWRMGLDDKDELSSSFRSANLYKYETDGTNGVEAINLDTGAVYGGALTAVGFSPKHLKHGYLFVLTVPVASRQRVPNEKILHRVIHVDKFGGPDLGCDTESVRTQKSGCFITTAVCEKLGFADDCEVLSCLRSFRDGYLARSPKAHLIGEYYARSPEIVDFIRRQADGRRLAGEVLEQFLWPVCGLIKSGRNSEAISLYETMVVELEKKAETRQ